MLCFRVTLLKDQCRLVEIKKILIEYDISNFNVAMTESAEVSF